MTCNNVPVILRLPMKRLANREGDDDGSGLDEMLEELSEILKASDITTVKGASLISNADTLNSSNMGAQDGEDFKVEKLNWWKDRKTLDERLMLLLEKIDTDWLGGLFCI